MSRGNWPTRPNEKRDAAIAVLLDAGFRAVVIANVHGISHQRVYQIRDREWRRPKQEARRAS